MPLVYNPTAKKAEPLPLHLRFLLKYLQNSGAPETALPPAYQNTLQSTIENPNSGYMPDLRRGDQVSPVTRSKTDNEIFRALGFKPSLAPQPVSGLYMSQPDSWKDVLGGSTSLQLARSLGTFTATPDTAARKWTVRDRYQFDRVDEGRMSLSDEGGPVPPTPFLPTLMGTPTFAIPRAIHGRGKPFDIRYSIPMSDSSLTRLRNFAATGTW